ncbi:MAG: cysteine hydrolase family protein [Luteimonas sp.]
MKALLVIDLQNDYFPGGKFPLEGADEALTHALTAIDQARQAGALIVPVQHVAAQGAPFFEEGSEGAALHPAIASATDGDRIVTKREADSFFETGLADLLKQADVKTLQILGMMTQHCVTHTALSPEARDYAVSILGKACAAPTRQLSGLALSGLQARLTVR